MESSKLGLMEKVNNLPTVPGVYKYKDSSGTIIYVGKAKNLRNRVKSYFAGNLERGSKTEALVSHIEDLEYIEAFSELEALILEAELIRALKPYYNINLKDDKSYLYIVIRKEKLDYLDISGEASTVNLPRVLVARRNDLEEKDIYFGPFPDATTTKYVVRTLRKAFEYRDCTKGKFYRYNKLHAPCLYGHIGLCKAPCVSKENIPAYLNDISRLKSLLEGKSTQVLRSIQTEMNRASAEQNFEEAARLRDILKKFDYIRQSFKTAQTYIDNPHFVEDILNKSLVELQKAIPSLNQLPTRIECYDISNISGKEAVGSMTVAIDGRLVNSEYRKFKIKLKNEPDDFEMMREVLYRRLTHKGWVKPDLLIVDGGKGQVSAAEQVINELGLEIALAGIAKKQEILVVKIGDVFEEIILDRTNEGLKLIQRLRDEAHRFAQKYHHYLRLKKISG